MKRVLFVGQEPETVDFSDPALPPGFDAEKIRGGIAAGMRQMSERGWQADLCLVRPDKSASIALERNLGAATYDCVVIGGGIRIPPKSLLLFETLINVVHKSAPSAFIAFNTRPEGHRSRCGSLAESRLSGNHRATLCVCSSTFVRLLIN